MNKYLPGVICVYENQKSKMSKNTEMGAGEMAQQSEYL